MSSTEVSYDELLGVPLHYDRLPGQYGTVGSRRKFASTKRLKQALEKSFSELFALWKLGKPDIILTAGTIGDGKGEHGKGLAFDIDGFVFGKKIFRMDSYPKNRELYVAINAHLFMHFTQVLSYHYPGHHDHFHVDFNFSRRYRPSSNAQTFFVQSAVRYLAGVDLGKSGREKDGVDGVWGSGTRDAIKTATAALGVPGADLSTSTGWTSFLEAVRKQGFAAADTFKT